MAKKKSDKEDKMILKLDNKWEWMAWAMKYRSKELRNGIIIVLVAVIIILAIFAYDGKLQDIVKSILDLIPGGGE